MDRYEEAIESYRKALESSPEFFPAWRCQGNILLNKLSRYEEAAHSYSQELILNPNSTIACLDKQLALIKLKRQKNKQKQMAQ